MYQKSRNTVLAQGTGSLSSYFAESRVLHREATSRHFLVTLPDSWSGFSSKFSVPVPCFPFIILRMRWDCSHLNGDLQHSLKPYAQLCMPSYG